METILFLSLACNIIIIPSFIIAILSLYRSEKTIIKFLLSDPGYAYGTAGWYPQYKAFDTYYVLNESWDRILTETKH